MTRQERQNLAAPCGVYCGACSAYVAFHRGNSGRLEEIARSIAERQGWKVEPDDLACEGCLSAELVATFCRNCSIRACAFQKGLTHCAQCTDFACQRITDFNNDGIRHHSEVLANIRRQKEVGVNAWLDEQEKRWRCPACGGSIDWYARQCPDCFSAVARQF